ncbi:hypothetical protein Rh054_04060 [Rickettsia conorii subsp. heilongjiangensis 054]|uniref:hypothetical protein n=1 Tax=Rickettsia conorii TaxID=781 RepID=UPI000219E637|nr:hypothetical protein [Rickettsia conorii]AEK74748.1 hypothetical protein Rh054_04060 [Rickettsia conorii subsp. heilongjiangensis 054]
MFENSKISLKKWFTAVLQVTTQKKVYHRYSFQEILMLPKQLHGFMLHRIREVTKLESFSIP